MTHTSGIWKVVGPSENGHCRRIFAGEEYIAIVGGWDQSIETIKANAALIASAPEMFDIIERLATVEQTNAKELSMLARKSRDILKKVKGT
jgi:hypothetical protein